MTDNVKELPVGKYDAVRTLRHCLQKAERGEIKECMVVYQCEDNKGEDSRDLGVYWSDMQRMDILWLVRWLNSWVNNRYFGRFHENPDD